MSGVLQVVFQNLRSFGPSPLALWGSGKDNQGQIGQPDSTDRSSPTQVGALTDWASLQTGQRSGLAVKTDGTLWVWGNGGDGRLGQNNLIYYSSPVQVGALTNWAKAEIRVQTAIAVKTDGTLWAWGNNDNGRMGNNDAIPYSSPVQIGSGTNWAFPTAGRRHSGAITTAGNLYMWGRNNQGRVGDGTTTDRSSPVLIGSGFSTVSAGTGDTFSHTLAIKTDGTLFSWGVKANGKLGTNQMTDNKSSPNIVGALTTWEYISAGRENSHGIRGGLLYGWGNASFIGNSSLMEASSPAQVGSATDWIQVSSTNENNVGALRADGSLWGWGRNENGELGQDSRLPLNASSPIQIGAGRTWVAVSTGQDFLMYLEEA